MPFSRMKVEMPLDLRSGPVRAMTTAVEATDALVMKALLPFRTHSPSLSSARVASAAASEPEPGSVRPQAPSTWPRSEEHTSELQSHVNLVCRLLLEKKKKKNKKDILGNKNNKK